MSENLNPLGNIYISHRAIATIAYQSALESYGVVGLAAKDLAEGITQVLVKDPVLGINVNFTNQAVDIDLYIIVEYGTRITMVASSVADSVRYQIEKMVALPVANVNVHVRGLRISNPD
ncbi:MAG TPA: Asp23/Gls24 family envelope stress response protein [Longilinea sp.]|nr:Asp23/Gls24 family envelope stress response protein [Longilinea sp.]